MCRRTTLVSVKCVVEHQSTRLTNQNPHPQPKYRGVIHGLSTLFFMSSTISSYLLNSLLPSQYHPYYWTLTLLLFAKSLSYFASALLHLYPFKSVRGVTEALKFDLIAIAASIGFTALPFASTYSDIMQTTAITTLFIGGQLVCVEWQFWGHTGLETPRNRSELPRNLLLVLQFLQTSRQIGEAMFYSFFWKAGIFTYAVAFCLAAPVTARHKEEPFFKVLPWHKKGIFSMHEDFHNVLLIADGIMVFNAVRFLGDKVAGWVV